MGSWWGGDTFLSHRRDKNGYPRAYRRRRRFRSSASRVPSRCPQSSAQDRCRHEPDRRIPLIRLLDKTSRLQLQRVVSRPAQASSAASVVERHNVCCWPSANGIGIPSAAVFVRRRDLYRSTWSSLPKTAFLSTDDCGRRGVEPADLRRLPQFDLVLDLMREFDAADGEDDFGRQFFVAFEAAGFHRVAHRLFDLALRGDADFLYKFAQAGVADV